MRVLIVIVLILVSCKKTKNGPIEELEDVVKDFKSFWIYYNKHIKLSRCFIAHDSDGNVISKVDFLKKLTEKKYFPLKYESHYKLVRISIKNKDIASTIKSLAEIELFNLSKIGSYLPDVSFVDINGNGINNILKGKYIVIKFWFIGCQKCIEEFPELNKLVAFYKSIRDDVVFVSLSSDKNTELKDFFSKKELHFFNIGEKDELIRKIGIEIFPTHIIVNKNKKILKVVNNYSDLEYSLNKELN